MLIKTRTEHGTSLHIVPKIQKLMRPSEILIAKLVKASSCDEIFANDGFCLVQVACCCTPRTSELNKNGTQTMRAQNIMIIIE